MPSTPPCMGWTRASSSPSRLSPIEQTGMSTRRRDKRSSQTFRSAPFRPDTGARLRPRRVRRHSPQARQQANLAMFRWAGFVSHSRAGTRLIADTAADSAARLVFQGGHGRRHPHCHSGAETMRPLAVCGEARLLPSNPRQGHPRLRPVTCAKIAARTDCRVPRRWWKLPRRHPSHPPKQKLSSKRSHRYQIVNKDTITYIIQKRQEQRQCV
jgi:hypothetical protein